MLILCLLCGCSESIEPIPAEISADFRPYVDEFRHYYIGEMPPYLYIVYGQPAAAYAECASNDSFYTEKTIMIRQSMWLGMEHEQKIGTMFHELGHCVLGLEHSSDPLSYMYPGLRTEQFYIDNKEILIEEMF